MDGKEKRKKFHFLETGNLCPACKHRLFIWVKKVDNTHKFIRIPLTCFHVGKGKLCKYWGRIMYLSIPLNLKASKDVKNIRFSLKKGFLLSYQDYKKTFIVEEIGQSDLEIINKLHVGGRWLT